MFPASVLTDLQDKFAALIRQTPAAELERQAKAFLAQGFAKLELTTREEFDVQTQVLARTREKLEALEKKVAELERLIAAQSAPPPAGPL